MLMCWKLRSPFSPSPVSLIRRLLHCKLPKVMSFAWNSVMNRHHGITHPEVSVQQNSTPCVMVFVFFNGLARDFCVDFFGKRLQILLAAFLCASYLASHSCLRSMKSEKRSFNKFWLLWLPWSLLKPLLGLPSASGLYPKNEHNTKRIVCLHNGSIFSVSVLRLSKADLRATHCDAVLLQFMVAVYCLHCLGYDRTDRNINSIDKLNVRRCPSKKPPSEAADAGPRLTDRSSRGWMTK